MGTHILTEEQLSMRIQLFLSAILFGCLLEVQSNSFLIETEDAGSKQPDEFDSEELAKKIEQVLTELMRISADDDVGDGNDYSGIPKRRALFTSLILTLAGLGAAWFTATG